MHHKFIHILTIVLALLAFTSLSSAMVDMPCMDSHEQPAHQMNHADMDHSMDHTKDQPMDCCEDGGNCNMTTCSTVALIVEPQANSQTAQHNQSIDLYSDQAIASISSSLYRPPINC
ncbi:hypothetical protein [Kangiella koreensis]|uniref:Uncharacterized protein n=1 Tax=Kangiella koreensis (strain DSM 16069 / JCM 12317 / KCTC 12182 / SW-125) TaxID=523791 RepID=C7RCM6_KANKD|nr:hypothetical protein [Kangiella koreensis]ACV27018.1 conserved hypothetical protein [Kangiella koreensis DSM 16069]